MTDPSIRTKTTLRQDDQRWIGNGGEPIGKPRSIVLDRSAFDLASTFPNGFIPSGIGLARLSATGLYVPYAGSPSEVQTVTVDATGGNITLKVDGETTANISATATAGQMQTALELLSNVQPGDIVVTGGPGNAGGTTPYTLTFGGQYIGKNVPAVVATGVSLTGGASTVTVATSGAGGGPASADGSGVAKGLLFAAVPYDRDSTGDISAALFWSGEVVVSKLPTSNGLDAAARLALPFISFV